mgnify:CR=1 FL=1
MKNYIKIILWLLFLSVGCTQVSTNEADSLEEMTAFYQSIIYDPQCPKPTEAIKWDTIHIVPLKAKMYRVVAGKTSCTALETILMDRHHNKYRWYSGIPEFYRTAHKNDDYQNSDRLAEEVVNQFLSYTYCPCKDLVPAVYKMIAFNYKSEMPGKAFFTPSELALERKALNDSILPMLKMSGDEKDIVLFNQKLDTLIANYDFNRIYSHTLVVGYRVICNDKTKKSFLVSRILNPFLVRKETIVHEYVK